MTDVHLHMTESVAEYQVTGFQLTATEVVGVGPLVAGEVRQEHASGLPGHHDQPGAVEPVRTRSAPHVWLAELRFGVRHRLRAAPGFSGRDPCHRGAAASVATASSSMPRDRREPDRPGVARTPMVRRGVGARRDVRCRRLRDRWRCGPGRCGPGKGASRQAARGNPRGMPAAAGHQQPQPSTEHDHGHRHRRRLRQYLLAGSWARPPMPGRSRRPPHQRTWRRQRAPGRQRGSEPAGRRQRRKQLPGQHVTVRQTRLIADRDDAVSGEFIVSREFFALDRIVAEHKIIAHPERTSGPELLAHRRLGSRQTGLPGRHKAGGNEVAPGPSRAPGPVGPRDENRAEAQREKEPQEVREDERGQIGGQHGEAPRCGGTSRPDHQ